MDILASHTRATEGPYKGARSSAICSADSVTLCRWVQDGSAATANAAATFAISGHL